VSHSYGKIGGSLGSDLEMVTIPWLSTACWITRGYPIFPPLKKKVKNTETMSKVSQGRVRQESKENQVLIAGWPCPLLLLSRHRTPAASGSVRTSPWLGSFQRGVWTGLNSSRWSSSSSNTPGVGFGHSVPVSPAHMSSTVQEASQVRS